MSPRSCVSLSQLSSLVVDDVGSFDQANTACALNRLAKMYAARYTSLSQTNLLSGDEQQQARQELRPALEALTKRLTQIIYSCSAWDITVSLWSFAQLGWHDEATLQSLCDAALQLTPTFKPVDCAQTVTAFTQIGYVHPELLRHIVTVGLYPTSTAHTASATVHTDTLTVNGAHRPPPPSPCPRMHARHLTNCTLLQRFSLSSSHVTSCLLPVHLLWLLPLRTHGPQRPGSTVPAALTPASDALSSTRTTSWLPRGAAAFH